MGGEFGEGFTELVLAGIIVDCPIGDVVEDVAFQTELPHVNVGGLAAAEMLASTKERHEAVDAIAVFETAQRQLRDKFADALETLIGDFGLLRTILRARVGSGRRNHAGFEVETAVGASVAARNWAMAAFRDTSSSSRDFCCALRKSSISSIGIRNSSIAPISTPPCLKYSGRAQRASGSSPPAGDW